jgi:hypothetical protein
MVLAMLRCSVVGKWTGGAVGDEKGILIGGCKVFGQLLSQVLVIPIVYYVSASCLPGARQPCKSCDGCADGIRVPSLGGYQLRDVALQLG